MTAEFDAVHKDDLRNEFFLNIYDRMYSPLQGHLYFDICIVNKVKYPLMWFAMKQL